MSGFKRIIVENKYQKNKVQRNLCFRSNWEIAFAGFLDSNRNVKEWRNDYPIKYHDKYNSQKIKTYFVDFKIEMTDGSTMLVEVKPLKSLQPRIETHSMRFKQIHTINYLKNLGKFETVELFCRRIGWKFFIASKGEHTFRFYTWDIKNRRPVSI